MSFAILLSLILALVATIYLWVRSKFTYFDKKGFLYEKPVLPLGNLNGIGTKLHMCDIMKNLYDQFKDRAPAFGLYFFTNPSFVVTDLDVIKDIMIKNFANFQNRGVYNHPEKDPLSAHLFAIDGDVWKNMRASLTPTFTSGKMKMMFNTVLNISNTLVESVQAGSGSGTIEVKDYLARFTTDVIGNVAFGFDSNSLKDPESIFRRMGRRAITADKMEQFKILLISSFKNIAYILGARMVPKEVSDFFLGIINDTVQYRKVNNIERSDFMNLLLKVKYQGRDLTFNELAAQSYLFWLAGFETSSSTSTFSLYNLAVHQDVQDRLREEITTVLAKYNDEITYEGMMEMKYLQMVIEETLRLYTPVTALQREAVRDYNIPNTKLVIPAGSGITIPVHAIHTDPQYFPEPAKFDPERFTEENKKARHPMAHIPFGDGPRNCIGLRFGLMQSKLSLIQLLLKFKFSPCEKTTIPMELDNAAFVMSPRYNMWLKIEAL